MSSPTNDTDALVGTRTSWTSFPVGTGALERTLNTGPMSVGFAVRTPTTSNEGAHGRTPETLMTPGVGRTPKTPHDAAVPLMEPAVSVPSPMSASPAATAAAGP